VVEGLVDAGNKADCNLSHPAMYADKIVIASEARQSSCDGGTGLLRFARNDDGGSF
jgi:hypothetical protein